jgi:amino acid transporter
VVQPVHNFTFSGFMVGFTLMLFIYWGWDTAVSVNEETKDSQTTPGGRPCCPPSSSWPPTPW